MYRDDGGFDGGSCKFVEIVEKPRNIDPPPSPVLFVFSSNCFDVFFDHMISPRDSKLTRDYIYIYINLIFRFIRFSFLFGFTLSLSLITYWKTDQTYCVIYETPDSIFSKGRVRSRLTCFILVLREPFSSRKIIKQLSPLVDVRYLAKKRSVEKRRNHTPLSLSLGTGEMIREDNSETSSNYRPPFPTTSSSLDKAPSSDPPLLPPLSTL